MFGSHAAGAMSSGFWLIGCHCCAPAGRVDQLVIVIEQQAEVVLAPVGRSVDPRSLDAARHGVLAAAAVVGADPAEALRGEVATRGRRAELRRVAVAVRLAESVPAGGERDGLFMVHRHALERHLDVARRLQRVGVAARAFGIDVDQAHLDRRQRAFEHFHAVRRVDAGLHAFVDPLVFRAPVDVTLGFEHVGAAAAEAEGRAAHRFDRDVAGEDEQVGPRDILAVLLLDRPQQAAGLVEVAVVGPRIERGEALLARIGAAAPVGRAVGTRRVPRHADEERAVMAVIGRPPGLAVGHQRGQVGLERLVVDRVERLGVVEVLTQRVGRPVGVEDLGRQHFRPPVLVGAAEQRANAAAMGDGATAFDRSGFGVHDSLSCVVLSRRDSCRAKMTRRH